MLWPMCAKPGGTSQLVSDANDPPELGLDSFARPDPPSPHGSLLRTFPWFYDSPRTAACVSLGLGIILVVGAEFCASIALPIDYHRKPFEARLPYAFGASLPLLYVLVSVHASGVRRDFEALTPWLPSTSASAEAMAELLVGRRRIVVAFIGLSALGAVVLQEANTQRWSRFLVGNWNAFDVWSAAMVSCFLILAYQSYAIVISSALVLRRVGGELVEFNPFDTRVARPFVRFILRIVLLFIVLPLVGFSVQAALVPGAHWTYITIVAINVVFAAVCVLVPIQTLSGRIQRWKEAELERLEQAIAEEPPMVDDHGAGAGPDLMELLAYRNEVNALHAMPFDRPALATFVLYGLLPPLSWAAAAVVERLVDRALG